MRFQAESLVDYSLALSYCILRLRLPGNRSLKGKRQVLRKIVERVKQKFNVSIAEIGDNDSWQMAVLGIAVVSNDRRFNDSALSTVVGFIDTLYLAEIVDYSIRSL